MNAAASNFCNLAAPLQGHVKAVLDAIATPIGLFDLQGNVIEVNATALNESGLTYADILGKPFWSSRWFGENEDLQGRVEEAIRGAVSGVVTRERFIGRLAGGAEAPMDMQFSPVRGPEGKVHAVIATGVSVLQQLLAENAAELDRERLKEAQRIAKVGSWELDVTQKTLCWSSEIFQILGYEAGTTEPSYSTFLSVVHPDDRNRVDDAYRTALREQGRHEIEYRLLARNGRVKWVRERCETSPSDEGRPSMLRGTLQDLTEMKAAQDALWRSEQTLSSILGVSHEAIIVTDQAGTVRLFSQGAENIFRTSQHEILGRRIDELIPERFRAAHTHHLTRFAAATDASLRMGDRSEIIGLRKTGEEFAAEASVSKVVCDEGVVFAVILRDVSERKAYEAALRTAKQRAERGSEAKSAFLATMSHEIRTPMNGVLGMLSVLQNTILDDSQNDIVETALDAARSLMEILNDILDYSKIEAGALRIEMAPFDVRTTLNKVCSLHVLTASRKQVRLTAEIAADLPPTIIGDEARIRQILHNLVGNAVKFTAEGSVRVQANRNIQLNQEFLEIAVTDTGIGMTAEQLEHIFDRFSQADSSITRRFGGSGLGLAIVKGLVENMGGVIRVSSQLGRGSTFSVTLPISAGSGSPLGSRETNTSSSKQATLRVLVVEDNDANAKVLQLLLAREDVALTLARNGEEAIAAFEPGLFDLILMDIQMPVLDGESATKVIRRLEDGAKEGPSFIIACTAFVGSEKNAHYLRVGFDNVIEKPVDAAKLRSVIDGVRKTQQGSVRIKTA